MRVGLNRLGGRFDIILDPAKDRSRSSRIGVEQHIRGARVAIARLTDRANIDHGLLTLGDEIGRAPEHAGRSKRIVFEEHPGDMRVADEADMADERENLGHLLDVLGVLRHHIFAGRLAGAAVGEQEGPVLSVQLQVVEDLQAAGADLVVTSRVEMFTSPINRPLGARIEVLGAVEQGFFVVAHEDAAAALNEVEALTRIRAIANDIAQAHDFFGAA